MNDSSSKQVSEDGGRKPIRRRRPWTMRLFRIGIILLAVATILRIALAILLPIAIDRAARFYGLSCDYSRARLGLAGGYATLWDISVSPREGGEPILKAEFCEATISTLNLLRGRLVVWRVGADGVWVDVQRPADGTFPLLQRFASPPAKAAVQTSAASPRELDLAAPFQVEAFRLTHLRAHIQDRSVTPVFEATVNADVRVSDLGQGARPARIEVDVWSEQVLDELRLDGEASSVGRNVKAKFRVQAHGINPTGAPGYLQAFGIRPSSNDINMTANLTVETSAVEGTMQALRGTATLRDIRIHCDGADALKIGSIELKSRYIGPDRIDAGTMTIADITASAAHTPEGFAFGGLIYTGMAKGTTPVPPATAPAAPVVASTQPVALPKVSLDELVIRNVRFSFTDQAIAPAAKLGLTLKTLRLANLATYAAAERQPVQLSAELSAEGIAQTITITGKADPFATAKNGTFLLHVGGIRLDAVRPYLEAAGLESTLENAALNCEVSAAFSARADGKLEGDIKASDLSLSDRGPLLKLSDARITGCEVDPKTLAVRIGAIDIAGPSVSGWRDAKGQVTVLGLRTRPATRQTLVAPAQAAPASTPATAVVLPIPRIRIDRFTWKGIHLDMQDDFVKPATKLVMTDAGIELTDMALELASTTQPAQQGKLRAWMQFPGVVDDLQVKGTITPTLHSTKLATDIRLEGITGGLLAPYLSAAGITSMLQKGSFRAHAEASAELTSGGLAAELLLNDLRLEDAGKLLAGVDGLQVEGLRMESRLLAVHSTKVSKPHIAVARDADGSLIVLGLKLGGTAAPARSAQTSPKIPNLPLIAAQQLVMENAQVEWTDRMFTPAVQMRASADVTLTGLKLGTKAEAAKLKLHASMPGNVEDINIEGQLATSPGEFGLDGTLAAKGIKGGSIEAYLPPALAVGTRDGQANLRLLLNAANNPSGGISVTLEVRNLDLRETAGTTPLLALESFKASASRIDPAGMVIALDELSVHGLLASGERSAAGDILVAGMRSLAYSAVGRPIPVALKERQQPQGEQEVSAILAAARQAMPEVSIAKLLVDVPEIRFRDLMRPASAPLAIQNLQLWNLDRLVWLGKDPMSQPPNRFELTVRVDPVVDLLHLSAEIAPLAALTTAHLHVNASGIHGAGVNALVPELAGKLDGSTLNDGRLEADLEASARIGRHGPMQFDLQHEFQVDLAIHDVALRNGSDPRVLAGVQEVRATGVKVDPTGHLVQAPSVEITKPTAYVSRDVAGLHALGLLIPLSAPGANQPPSTVEAARIHNDETGEPAKAAGNAPMDIAISRLTVSGIDVLYEDKAFSPAVIVPLNQLDVEVRDVGTTSLKQNRPIRFSVILGSAGVEMVKRGRGRLGAGAQTGIEQRDLFSLATANGAISLYPQANGWAKASLNGLELMAFGGAARQFQMDLYDGILDCNLDVRVHSQKDADVRTRVVVTDLSISEPPDGPIARVMKLSTPLDTTLRFLEDPDGSITLPAKFSITNGQLSYGAMVNSALEAVAQAVATAIASSPVKLVKGVGGLFGAEAPKGHKEAPTAVISFAPGSASVDPSEMLLLQEMTERARRDSSVQLVLRHELSEADRLLAEARANPSPEDAMDMIRTLRSRKQDLLAQEDVQSVTVRTRLASLSEAAAQGDLQDLQASWRQLAAVESSLDQLLDLQRPGADRQAGRRARAMALEIAQARLDAVQQIIAQSPQLKQRTMVAPPSAQVIDGLASGQVVITLAARQH